MQSTVNFFPDANNINFTSSNPLFQTSVYSTHSGIHILSQKISTAAMHDSSDRYLPPKCYPGTRDTAIKILIEFVKCPVGDKPVKWMHAPFGHGKSAVMQSSVETLTNMGLLDHFGGAFFFGRDDPQRNNPHLLLPTIAYQIARHVPGMEEHISAAIINDPILPSKSIETQLVPLLVTPFRRWIQPSGLTPTVFIDGLDECGSSSAQRSVLKMVEDAVVTHRLPLRFVIASRPESHIADFFNRQVFSEITQIFRLNDEDPRMWKYFRDEFARVRQSRLDLAIAEDWPSEPAIWNLMNRASGQYLFANTIIRFVEDEYEDPRKQLQIVLEPEPHPRQSSAFSPMDTLYIKLLSAVPAHHRDHLLRILSALLVLKPYPNELSLEALSAFLELDSSVVSNILRRLGAVINNSLKRLELPKDITLPALSWVLSPEVSTYHISFEEFLVDESRSQEFWVDREAMWEELRCRLDYMLSRCLIGVEFHPLVLREIPKLLPTRDSFEATTPFGESFPRFNRQYAVFLDKVRLKGQLSYTATQLRGSFCRLLLHITAQYDFHLTYGCADSTLAECRDLLRCLVSGAFEQLVNQSPHTSDLFQIVRHLYDDKSTIYSPIDKLCQKLPAHMIVNVLDDFQSFLTIHCDVGRPTAYICIEAPIVTILVDEDMSGRKSHCNFREARIHNILDWFTPDKISDFISTSKYRAYPQTSMTLEAHDEDPGSAFPSLLHYLCSPPLVEALLASKLLRTVKYLAIFLIFITKNSQESSKLKLKVSDNLYKLLDTLVKHDIIIDVLSENLPYDEIGVRSTPEPEGHRIDERPSLLPYLFHEPWQSLMRTSDYTAILIYCLNCYDLSVLETSLHIPWPELFANGGTSLGEGSQALSLEIAILRLHDSIQDYVDCEVPKLVNEAQTEICLPRPDFPLLIQAIGEWGKRLTLADLQEHQELSKAIDYLVDFQRPDDYRFSMPGSYPDSDTAST